MGKKVISKYVQHSLYFSPNHKTPMKLVNTWEGCPSARNLEKRVRYYNSSLQIGSVNDYMSKKLGFTPHIYQSVIINQYNGKIVTEWKNSK